jgi:uncharacterized MnhB-related membrane protein
MSLLQSVVLVGVAAMSVAVVRARDRVRQVLVLSTYGVLLAVLFFTFQAPDVALSELTVGAVVLPLILLLAISKVREHDQAREGTTREGATRESSAPGEKNGGGKEQ